ncbi:hypothetical protein HYT04_01555, partial [Candidatus Kaiserbacteria bacterium]|nr:hypothetical protein [Candidatus Kaiserbacteria bacterium]
MPDFSPLYSPFTSQFAAIFIPLIFVVVLWTIVLKGYSLWTAARAGQKKWFIVLLVINTFGILEIVYLIWFRPKNVGRIVSETPVNISSSA